MNKREMVEKAKAGQIMSRAIEEGPKRYREGAGAGTTGSYENNSCTSGKYAR